MKKIPKLFLKLLTHESQSVREFCKDFKLFNLTSFKESEDSLSISFYIVKDRVINFYMLPQKLFPGMNRCLIESKIIDSETKEEIKLLFRCSYPDLEDLQESFQLAICASRCSSHSEALHEVSTWRFYQSLLN